MRGFSRERIYQELRLVSLEQRRWDIVHAPKAANTTKVETKLQLLMQNLTDFFNFFFFPATINEWNKLNHNIQNSENIFFKKKKKGFTQLSRLAKSF